MFHTRIVVGAENVSERTEFAQAGSRFFDNRSLIDRDKSECRHLHDMPQQPLFWFYRAEFDFRIATDSPQSRAPGRHFHFFSDRQCEMERGSPPIVGRGPQMAAMRFDDGPADRQAHP